MLISFSLFSLKGLCEDGCEEELEHHELWLLVLWTQEKYKLLLSYVGKALGGGAFWISFLFRY